jgi:hypothetical protein
MPLSATSGRKRRDGFGSIRALPMAEVLLNATDDPSSAYEAKIDSFELGLQVKKEQEDKNLDLDVAVLLVLRGVNVQFANRLVDNAERQQKAPR